MFLRKYSSGTKCINDVFRNSMSLIPIQAMILTVGAKEGTRNYQNHGMTLGSVCSLSVHPRPLLQFNLHLPSYTSKVLHKNPFFAIHTLSPAPDSSRMARIFASGIKNTSQLSHEDQNEQVDSKDTKILNEMTNPFGNLNSDDWSLYDYQGFQIPVLNSSVRIFICEKVQVFEVDSHEIWVVTVKEIIENNNNKPGGLLYFNRAFHEVGETIKE